MEKAPFYAIKDSPVNDSPLSLFSAEEDGEFWRRNTAYPAAISAR